MRCKDNSEFWKAQDVATCSNHSALTG